MLQICSIDIGFTEACDESVVALADAIAAAVSRNLSLLAHRQSLLQLARWDSSVGFRSLQQGTFRNKILEFLFPPGGEFQPLGPNHLDRIMMSSSTSGASLAENLAANSGAYEERIQDATKDELLNHTIGAMHLQALCREDEDDVRRNLESAKDNRPEVDAEDPDEFAISRTASHVDEGGAGRDGCFKECRAASQVRVPSSYCLTPAFR